MAGKAGSLLIDIAANTAQLKKDLDVANQQLGTFGKSVQAAGAVVGVAMGGLVAKEVLSFLHDMIGAVGKLADASAAVGLSTRDFQAFTLALRDAGMTASEAQGALASGANFLGKALQGNKENIDLLNRLKVNLLDSKGVAKDYATDLQNLSKAILGINDPLKQAAIVQQVFNKSAAEALPALKQWAEGADKLATAYSRQIIPDDTIQRAKALGDALSEAGRKAGADIAVALDSITKGADVGSLGLKGLLDLLDDIGKNGRALAASQLGENIGKMWAVSLAPLYATLALLNEIIRLGSQLPSLIIAATEAAEKGATAVRRFAEDAVRPGTGTSQNAYGIDFRTEAEKAAQGKRDQEDRQRQINRDTEDRMREAKYAAQLEDQARRLREARERLSAEAYGPPAPAGLGGRNPPPRATGGGGRNDPYAQTLEGLRNQTAAVNAGIEVFLRSSGLATKEAERLAQLEINIAKAQTDAIGKAKTGDPKRIEALREEARILELTKFRFEELKATQATADAINEKYADGTRKLADQMFYLNKARDAGLIGQVEYNAAVFDYNKAAENQKDINEGLKGGIDAIAAGWRTGARGLNDQLAEFKIGQDLFAGGFKLMQSAISEFVTTGTIDFGKLAQSFAAMLADMAAKWAASKIMNAIFDALPSFGSSPSPGLKTFGENLGTGGFMAEGGNVFAGRAYTVGEAGPETFVPSVAGRIVPNGGGDVYVNIANYTDSKVSAGKSKGPGGQMQVDVIVEAVEGKMAARLSRGQGSLGKTIEGSYGLQRVGR